LQYSLVTELAAGCIQIHTGTARSRKKEGKTAFISFRSLTYRIELVTTTGWAVRRDLSFTAAVMTTHFLPTLMVGKTYIALFAAGDIAALIAGYIRCIASSVLKN